MKPFASIKKRGKIQKVQSLTEQLSSTALKWIYEDLRKFVTFHKYWPGVVLVFLPKSYLNCINTHAHPYVTDAAVYTSEREKGSSDYVFNKAVTRPTVAKSREFC